MTRIDSADSMKRTAMKLKTWSDVSMSPGGHRYPSVDRLERAIEPVSTSNWGRSSHLSLAFSVCLDTIDMRNHSFSNTVMIRPIPSGHGYWVNERPFGDQNPVLDRTKHWDPFAPNRSHSWKERRPDDLDELRLNGRERERAASIRTSLRKRWSVNNYDYSSRRRADVGLNVKWIWSWKEYWNCFYTVW